MLAHCLGCSRTAHIFAGRRQYGVRAFHPRGARARSQNARVPRVPGSTTWNIVHTKERRYAPSFLCISASWHWLTCTGKQVAGLIT